MRTLLVDDEPLARRELRRLLAPLEWIDICGEASHIDEAETCIARLCPDLLFLDIQMPGGTGFDLLSRLTDTPQVIFTTAHDEHAIRAFEVNALDYLLKPVEPERLQAALAKLSHRAPRAGAAPAGPLRQLFVRDGARCWFIPLHEVSLFSAEGNYVRLRWGQRQPLLGRPLIALEERLDPQQYFRANRQQIINLDFITEVDIGVNGRLHVQLREGPEVEISRRQARFFRQLSGV